MCVCVCERERERERDFLPLSARGQKIDLKEEARVRKMRKKIETMAPLLLTDRQFDDGPNSDGLMGSARAFNLDGDVKSRAQVWPQDRCLINSAALG